MNWKKLSLLLGTSIMLSMPVMAGNTWQRIEGNTVPAKGSRVIIPEKYLVYNALEGVLKDLLNNVSDDPAQAVIFALPMPDGEMKNFRVWSNHTMASGLVARYAGIMTFTGEALEAPGVTAKIDLTLKGFHAMIFDGANTAFIDPYSNEADGYYISYYKNDYTRAAGTLMSCSVDGTIGNLPVSASEGAAQRTINGNQLRTYRMALACTGEYAVAVAGTTPTKAAVLSAMVTTMNRVNGVYERELACTMQLINNEDTLIFLSGTSDPYTNGSGGTMLGENQTTVTARIGSANYDIGHVFSTGGGGIASLASICRTNTKAQGVTGSASPTGDAYDIDYVAHEMGHQFGSDHTFNNNVSGSCSGNAERLLAYEPGGGTTIMAYAGICSPNNVQSHSDDYFHAKSLVNIVANINSTSINSCPTITTSGNRSVSIPAFTQSYSIPYKTPFELTAPQAVDSVANTSTTYCWEQWNLGSFGALIDNTHLSGPIFRSFLPDTGRTRVFPIISKIIANTNTYLGERVPDTARYLTFKLSVRALLNGVGSVHFPDDSIHLDVINTGTPFVVMSPNLSTINWVGATTQIVTWDVAGTTAAPINAATVDIYLSVDGGYTYPYILATAVANTGTANIIVPNVATTSLARVKVKGTGNVFFDISNFNFTITKSTNVGVAGTGVLEDVRIYPNPAASEVYLSTSSKDDLQIVLTDMMGKIIYSKSVTGNTTIPVNSLARSIYYLKVSNTKTGQSKTQKLVLQ